MKTLLKTMCFCVRVIGGVAGFIYGLLELALDLADSWLGSMERKLR